MLTWLSHLDRILRGEATKPQELAGGTLRVPIFGLAVVIDVLGIYYGACMGLFSVMGRDTNRWMQIPASMVKVPALFLLTLVITVPSLYTFNALVGSRLKMLAVIRLLTASVAVMLAVLSSLGTILAFFSISTASYPFMVLLNVAIFSVSGMLGLRFLLQTLHRLTRVVDLEDQLAQPTVISPAGPVAVEGGPPPVSASASMPLSTPFGALVHAPQEPMGKHVKKVFRIWLVVFALVGAQMSWDLRPFIGNPDQPFTWLRPRESNFFEGVIKNIGQLMGLDQKPHRRNWKAS